MQDPIGCAPGSKRLSFPDSADRAGSVGIVIAVVRKLRRRVKAGPLRCITDDLNRDLVGLAEIERPTSNALPAAEAPDTAQGKRAVTGATNGVARTKVHQGVVLVVGVSRAGGNIDGHGTGRPARGERTHLDVGWIESRHVCHVDGAGSAKGDISNAQCRSTRAWGRQRAARAHTQIAAACADLHIAAQIARRSHSDSSHIGHGTVGIQRAIHRQGSGEAAVVTAHREAVCRTLCDGAAIAAIERARIGPVAHGQCGAAAQADGAGTIQRSDGAGGAVQIHRAAVHCRDGGCAAHRHRASIKRTDRGRIHHVGAARSRQGRQRRGTCHRCKVQAVRRGVRIAHGTKVLAHIGEGRRATRTHRQSAAGKQAAGAADVQCAGGYRGAAIVGVDSTQNQRAIPRLGQAKAGATDDRIHSQFSSGVAAVRNVEGPGGAAEG